MNEHLYELCYEVQDAQIHSFFQIPKILFEERYAGLDPLAKFLYGVLLDRKSLSIKNNWIDENGKIYVRCSREQVMQKFFIGKQKAANLFRQLSEFELIYEKKQGQGNCNIIYIVDLRNAGRLCYQDEVEKDIQARMGTETFENCTPNNGALDSEKVDANNNNYNKLNNYSSSAREMEKIENKQKVADCYFSVEDKLSEYGFKINTDEILESINQHGIEYVKDLVLNPLNYAVGDIKNLEGFIKVGLRKKYRKPIKVKGTGVSKKPTGPPIKKYYREEKPIQFRNFDQRTYSQEFFDSLYEEL